MLLLVWLVSLVGGGGSGHKGHETAATSTTRPLTLGVGLRTVTWTNPHGLAVSAVPGGSATPRTLVTQIWYPSVGASTTTPSANAPEDYSGGPYPVVVFAHGFDTLPQTYTPLLDSYVLAGYVVVAPLFPDENADKVAALGPSPSEDELQTLESDIVNEPDDLAYVVGQVVAAAGGDAATDATFLHGLANPAKLALVGQSDGASAVAMLVYAQYFASTYAALAVKPFAVQVISGNELPATEVGSYAPPSPAPAVLSVQSATDECNLPQNAQALYESMGPGWFLKLDDASHFGPVTGEPPAAVPTEKTTAGWLDEVRGTGGTDLTEVADVAGVSQLYDTSQHASLTALPTPSATAEAAACAPPKSTSG